MTDWEWYRTSLGKDVVKDEIRRALPTKPATIVLGALLRRISDGTTLGRDVGKLNSDLLEARMTWEGREFRLHFARTASGGVPVLLALHVVNKKAQKAKPQDIAVSMDRLRDWEQRSASA